MASPPRADYYIGAEDYLAGERLSQEKHEYLAGAIYAMAGTSIGHNRIAANILGNLRQQLHGQPCEAFSSDVKVRIRKEATDFFYYPDVTVDCSGPADASVFSEEPRVIFEVLSKETERIDRGEKLLNYRTIASLEVYALVDQFHVAGHGLSPHDRGVGVEFLTEKSDLLAMPSIDCNLPLASIYERTHL